MTSVESDTAAWYRDYYARRGADRNDRLRNAGVLFQTLAYEASLTRAFRRLETDPGDARVLDVGCGGGGSLLALVALGFQPTNMAGIDLLEDRVEAARAVLPSADIRGGDGASLPFAGDTFDVVFESTVFAQLSDPVVAAAVAEEMIRVLRPGGLIILADWRMSRPFDKASGSLSSRRVRVLFPSCELIARERGQLVPPVGRWFSAHCAPLYFLVARLAPALVGQVVYVLRPPAIG